MHLLVLGSSGLVGSNFVTTALTRDETVVGTYRSALPAFDVPIHQLDIRDTETFRQLLRRTAPDVVINCAAMTDVDKCEKNRKRAYAINAAAPGALAEVCNEKRIHFAHLSTDYVFDGEVDGSYDESTETNPIQVYGKSKLAGERAVRRQHDAPLIVRLSFVHGIHRASRSGEVAGLPAWIHGRLRAETSVPLFTDQRVSPTRAGQAAVCTLDLLRNQSEGTFHVACRSCVTPYEFGVALCDRLGDSDRLLERTSIEDIDRRASRPSNSCLDVQKLESSLKQEQPTIGDDLDVIASWLHENTG